MELPLQMEDLPCPLGCVKSDHFVLTGRDMLHGLPGDFTVVKCSTCGLMRTNPRPAPAGMGFYYPDNYGPYIGTQIDNTVSSGLRSIIKNSLRPIVNWIFDSKAFALPSIPPGRLLEVGCASGSFLNRMAKKGWHVEGIEYSEKAALAASQFGYKVHVGALETAPAPSAAIDLIVAWMVLEHLHDPIRCLKKLSDWANSAAWLVLSVPNANSLEFQIFKEKWYALQLPTHLTHFTPQTLAKVLEAGGWKVEKVHHQVSAANFFASVAYVLDEKGWPKLGKWICNFAWPRGIWFYVLYPISWVLSVFGQTGRMTVWARKQSDVDAPAVQVRPPVL